MVEDKGVTSYRPVQGF